MTEVGRFYYFVLLLLLLGGGRKPIQIIRKYTYRAGRLDTGAAGAALPCYQEGSRQACAEFLKIQDLKQAMVGSMALCTCGTLL